MMSLEQQLAELGGHLITVVRPSFGHQSDSWMGEFHVYQGKPFYQLVVNEFAMMFRLSDVVSVQRTPSLSSAPHSIAIVRLKGPVDY